jgi:hypothetical protein
VQPVCRIAAVVLVAASSFVSGGSVRAESPAPSGSPADPHLAAYSEKIRPLFAERCFSCHGGLKQEAGLRLDTVALMVEGGESGGVVTKGDPDASLILERVSDTDPLTRMPPEGEGEPLSAEQLAMLKDWIKASCPAPADEKPEADPRSHWAFQPRVRPEIPAVKNTAWVKNPIDAFLARRHEEAGISPQPEPPQHVLVRRLYLDLVGLPPQPEELAAIEADASADWYEKLVEKLLADPRHGERWGRHWMDVWRYSDWWGLGNEHRYSQKHMWHFRDWIVESLNADTPYDEMVRLMLAADELHPDDLAKLRATGFLARNWFLFNRTPWMDETVEHVGKGLLGLTMNCSKCHAHKYDPIQQEDYYRFRAFFEPIETRVDVVAGEGNLEKDGIPRVFDGHLDRPTYLFVRGEDTKPDTSKKIEPGVPEVFSFREIEIQPVTLPENAFEPGRRPWVLDAHVATARRAMEAAEAAVAKAVEKEAAAKTAVAAAEEKAKPKPASSPSSPPAAPGSFVEDFASLDAGRWKLFGGDWKHEPGRLSQGKDGQTRAAVRLLPTPPRDFDATVRFTITGGSTYRSVGLSFDSSQPDPVTPHGADDGEVMVYASGWASGPKLQAAYVTKGAWQFPADGAVARPVELDRVHTLRVAVRDRLVNAWFDGEPLIAWRSPVPRREGSLQLITFDATAVFERVSLEPLPADVKLREPAGSVAVASPSVDEAHAILATAEREVAAAQAALAVEKASLESVFRRAQATRIARETDADAAEGATAKRVEAAKAAVRSEREIVLAKARQKVIEVEDRVAKAAAEKKAEVEKELATAHAAVETAVKAAAEPDEKFTPLVGAKWTPTRFKNSGADDPAVPYPATSSGRRTALAHWITDRRNPLTARVAANHIWMRHMGAPLVTTVFEFGRKGNAPTHPELLDWLASELVDGPSQAEGKAGPGWSMKHLHRLICTSAAYRMGSSTKGAGAALATDPDNRLLWRREPVRLESQVVRDAVLALAGTLDGTMGGPSVPDGQQANSRRRSLYLWHSDISRDLFLTMFDDASVTECYRREQSIVPQQALALSNAAVVHDSAAKIAERIAAAGVPAGDDSAFLERAFVLVLHRQPTAEEKAAFAGALVKWRAIEKPAGNVDPARVHAVWTLFNHNDFVTLR